MMSGGQTFKQLAHIVRGNGNAEDLPPALFIKIDELCFPRSTRER
jgi:hypothetical protein